MEIIWPNFRAAPRIRHNALAKRSAFASDIIAFAAPSAGGLDADSELELRLIVTDGEGEVGMIAWAVPYCINNNTRIFIASKRESAAKKHRVPEVSASTLIKIAPFLDMYVFMYLPHLNLHLFVTSNNPSALPFGDSIYLQYLDC